MRFRGFVFHFTFLFGSVDPNCFWKTSRFGNSAHETLWGLLPCIVKRLLSRRDDSFALAVVQR